MNFLIESCAWCILQVTLFSAVAVIAYMLARWLRASCLTAQLVISLTIVAVLTAAAISPWPRWSQLAVVLPDPMESTGEPAFEGGGFPQGADKLLTADTKPRSSSADLPDTQISSLLDLPASDAHFAAADPPSVVHSKRPNWHWLVMAAWVASLIGLLRLLLGIIHLRRCRRRSVLVADDELLQLADELRASYNIKRPVELRQFEQLGVAATVGWRRPLVLLPPSWCDWTADERRAVLAHELAHIRQSHFPAWLLAQATVVAHFYHPLVHWLARRLRFEQELAADALAATAFPDRRRYAAALAGLALGPRPASRLITPLGLFMSRPLLMRRIAMLRQTNEPSRFSSRRMRLVMFLVIATIGVGVAGLRAAVNTQVAHVVILFKVSREAADVPGGEAGKVNDSNWNTFCFTQIALIKSNWLMRVVLRNPEVAALPLVKAQTHPVAWLQQQVQADFPAASEILQIHMDCSPSDADQARQIVEAVAKAYEDEVLFKDRQQKLGMIDTLRRSLTRLSEEIRRDTSNYLDLVRELGSAAADGESQVTQQLVLRRLDRIEMELMRLENEQLEAKIAKDETKAEFHAVRIAQLKKRQEELENSIDKRNTKSADLTILEMKLKLSQQLASDMTVKLQALEIDKDSPPRVRRLYETAIISDASR